MTNKIYAQVLEDEALEQFNSAIAQKFTVKAALMPDAHKGYTLPIGAVVATKDVIVPAWVGYDIGCGMCAMKLSLKRDEILDFKDEIFDEIYKAIPVGFNKNLIGIPYSLEGLTETGERIALEKMHKRALGSLGGGNHFIEIGYDEKDSVWIIIHSGSRGVGHGIATNYIKLAHPEGKAKEGHYGFNVFSDNGANYIKDLNWCLEFALANRMEMMQRVVGVIEDTLGTEENIAIYSNVINRNHNHAELNHEGLWVHRKGATHAEKNMMGVIPGNMRDGSFIVRGKGNPDSLYSSSHGAGRVLGRKAAERVLNVEDFEKTMQGVKAKVDKSTLDESPEAYKDIFEVMRLQIDLVELVHHIKPIINIKG